MSPGTRVEGAYSAGNCCSALSTYLLKRSIDFVASGSQPKTLLHPMVAMMLSPPAGNGVLLTEQARLTDAESFELKV